MSYGYEPPKHETSGSWSEVFTLTRIVFGMLAPFMGALLGIVILLVVTVMLMSRHPLLGLIPLTPIVVGVYWVLRRERRQADAEAARIRGD